MEKRYQVFISSTYEDLKEARQEVMQALLELDCIPAGMELFPAANDDQWTLIKDVINDCDYYMVIIGGRYGSIGPEGISYTQMEYEYALEQDKPVIAFLHKDPESIPAKKSEKTKEGREKLEAFRELVKQRMVKYWISPADLGSVVSRSLVKLIKTNPAVGWVKADLLPDKETTEEILNLRKRIESLQAELEQMVAEAPSGTEDLAQGDDLVELSFIVEGYKRSVYSPEVSYSASFKISWNEIFARISPLMVDEATERAITVEVNRLIAEKNVDRFRDHSELQGYKLNFKIQSVDFNTVKVQYLALGLIAKSVKKRSLNNTDIYWTLTPYGNTVMTRLRAIRRSNSKSGRKAKKAV